MASETPYNIPSTSTSDAPFFAADEDNLTTTNSLMSISSSELTSLSSQSDSTSTDKEKSRRDEGGEVGEESLSGSEQELFNDTYTGKAPSREERVKYRDLLNTKLEQMFVKAKLELSPFGRIPWTRLGEALVARNCYITGFPEAFAPKTVNDQLTGGTAPSTWSINRSKPLLALIESGKLRVEQRPPGRKVLLELTRPDGTKYDSTIGYSTQWLQTHMPNEFPSKKRGRSEMMASSKSQSPSSYHDPDEDDWSDESLYDLAGKSGSWKPYYNNHKRPRLAESRSPSRVRDRRRSGTASQAPSSSRPQREKPKKMMEGIKAGEKWTEGGIVKKIGRGWIVVEDSSDTETPPEQSSSAAPSEKQVEVAPPEQVTSKKRKRSEPPESNQQSSKRVHPDDSPADRSSLSNEKRLRLVIAQIAKMIREAGYNGSKKIPWCSLPLFLCQRKLYITGFPYSCLPKVINDEVKNASSPPHWKPAQWIAMEEALDQNQVKILPRPRNRLVLFEAIGIDGNVYDSTCDFSVKWIDKNLKHYSPTPMATVPKEKQSTTVAPPKAKSPVSSFSRPSLKLVIPNTGQSVAAKPVPQIKIAKPPSRSTDVKGKGDKQQPTSPQVPPPTQIPRSTLPAPKILLQPPTPPAGRSPGIPTERLQLAESPMHESPSGPPTATNQAPTSSGLSPPPSPPPVEPVALPGSPANDQPRSIDANVAPVRPSFTFTFKIPPAKSTHKVIGSRKSDVQARNSVDSPSSLGSDSMLVDEARMDYSASGLDLGMMFDSPSRENPSGGLPSHLQPRMSNQTTPFEASHFSSGGGSDNSPSPLGKAFTQGGEIVATLPLNGTLESKYAIERRIRPSLVKLFDAAGLSSPGVPIPWVMLPTLLCQQRLFISGFPRQCLPKVVRDKVEGASSPRSWNYQALLAMFNALEAHEVKIKRRPKGRRVLFHLLPTDAQREMGHNDGIDSTLSFSNTWIDEHMVDYPEETMDKTVFLEPSDTPIILRESVLTPLRRDSVWERFGKITIDESESEDDNRVPDPPWKIALEEFIRPTKTIEKASRSSAPSKSDSSISSKEESDRDDSDEEVQPPLQITHLLPSHLPHPFQGKGRILLGRDDRFEWVPTDPYATDCPPTRMVWSPSLGRWKLLSELRDFASFNKRTVRLEIPNRVNGKVLGFGIVEHHAGSGVWECSFVGRGVFGDLRWSPDVASWEWFPQDIDGRRKWLGTSGRDYDSSHED